MVIGAADKEKNSGEKAATLAVETSDEATGDPHDGGAGILEYQLWQCNRPVAFGLAARVPIMPVMRSRDRAKEVEDNTIVPFMQHSHFQAAPALMSTSTHSTPMWKTHASATLTGVPQLVPEDVELTIAINASIQSAITEGVPINDTRPVVGPSNFSLCGTSSETATRPAISASVQVPPPRAMSISYMGYVYYSGRDPDHFVSGYLGLL